MLMGVVDKLERTILPMFYSQPETYARIVRFTMAVNGSFFNTQRMLSQYVREAYFPNIVNTACKTAAAVVRPLAELAHNE